MGCSATKNLVIEPLGFTGKDTAVTNLTENGHNLLNVSRKTSITRRASSDPPLESEEPVEEQLENVTMNNVLKTQRGMAFDIGFEEEESIIQKHPPKRFQKLEDMQIKSPIKSLDKLQEKMDEAEIRRQQILQNRIQSAKMRHILRKQASVNSMGNGETGYLKVPDEYENIKCE